MNPLENILKSDKTLTRWRKRYATGLPFEHVEAVTSSHRLAIRKVESAPDEPLIVSGLERTPPNIASIWPSRASLPHLLTFDPIAVQAMKALASLHVALRTKKKNTSSVTFTFLPPEEGQLDARLEIRSLGVKGTVKLVGCAMSKEGTPISFNPCYLVDAFHEGGSVLRYDATDRPALIEPHENAPLEAHNTLTIVMPLNAARQEQH